MSTLDVASRPQAAAKHPQARDEALRGLPKTASTLMVVSGFARPEFVVEIEALAAVSSSAAASAVASAASSAASAASSAASAASSDGGRGGSGDSASSRHVRSSRRSISATPAAASAVRSAAHGRRSLHTRPAPRRAQSRALHGERASAAAVAAYVEDLRGSWRLEAEDRFLHPNQRSRGHVFSCIRPYSAGFTIDSLYSACLRLHAAL